MILDATRDAGHRLGQLVSEMLAMNPAYRRHSGTSAILRGCARCAGLLGALVVPIVVGAQDHPAPSNAEPTPGGGFFQGLGDAFEKGLQRGLSGQPYEQGVFVLASGEQYACIGKPIAVPRANPGQRRVPAILNVMRADGTIVISANNCDDLAKAGLLRR